MEVFVAGEHTITLTKRPGPTKAGDWVYRRPGVKASIYVNKRIFARGTVPPETLTLTSQGADVFRFPNNLDPEATARRVEILKAKAQRKHEQADHAMRQAQELTERAQQEAEKLDSKYLANTAPLHRDAN